MRAILATVLLSTLVFSACPGVARAEPPRPQFIPDDFVNVYHFTGESEPGTRIMVLEYVPKGETDEKWSEFIKIVYSIQSRQFDAAPSMQAEGLIQDVMQACPGASGQVVRYPGQPGKPAGAWTVCPKNPQSGKREIAFSKGLLYSLPNGKETMLVLVLRIASGDKPKRTLKELQAWVEGVKDFLP